MDYGVNVENIQRLKKYKEVFDGLGRLLKRAALNI